ncbi:MAG: hypothetical protein Ta2F_06660 [Termitinemataceae bacterium]|nr:MAG: hypothetical protein Ta2F_06660 [Termitinemataceae bacterium]
MQKLNKNIRLKIIFFVFAAVFISCRSTQTYTPAASLITQTPKEAQINKSTQQKASSKHAEKEKGHVQKEVPPTPEFILGRGTVDSDKLAEFLLRSNRNLDKSFAHDFARIYVEEASAEGVNHDVAFSQMCLETGFLSFGGLVTPDMNNFCGLGSIGPGQAGETFPSPEIGVRAQIQHLKAYATDEPPTKEVVDPRRRWVRYGSAPTIYALAGAWAADREYGKKLKIILDTLYKQTFGG